MKGVASGIYLPPFKKKGLNFGTFKLVKVIDTTKQDFLSLFKKATGFAFQQATLIHLD